ncbi:hypothetical protein ACNQFZ_19185 [Schinkia sp. CFF1]
MKKIGIFFFTIVPLMALSFGIDLYQGFDAHSAVHNALSPFQVMDASEWIVIILFISLLLGEFFVSSYKKKRSIKGQA